MLGFFLKHLTNLSSFFAAVKMQNAPVISFEKWSTHTPCPRAAVREEWVEEQKEVARDLLDDVQKPEVPRHVNP